LVAFLNVRRLVAEGMDLELRAVRVEEPSFVPVAKETLCVLTIAAKGGGWKEGCMPVVWSVRINSRWNENPNNWKLAIFDFP
jgi:hypothetical protein